VRDPGGGEAWHARTHSRGGPRHASTLAPTRRTWTTRVAAAVAAAAATTTAALAGSRICRVAAVSALPDTAS
jgi:hypothetical protein